MLLITAMAVNAQVPQQFNYQGAARNANGTPLANKAITIRIGILDGSANGPVQYSETRKITTNALGLYTLIIGSTNAVSVTGTISSINWASGPKYIQVEIDVDNGNNFVIAGSSQLLSVPYAIYASSGAGAKGDIGLTGPAGPQGLVGATGPIGPQGLPGAKGDIGLTGAVGPQGLAGATGPIGLTGAAGPQGLIGLTGATGAAGPAGPQGLVGATGPIGPQGLPGATTITTANNGLTLTSNNIKLGGALTVPTTLISDATNTLSLFGLEATTTLSTDNFIVSDATGLLKKVPTNSLTNNWNLTGNAGTTATTNFIGTKDDVGLNFRVGGLQVASFTNSTATNRDSFFIGKRAGYLATNAFSSYFSGYGAGENALNASHALFIGNESGHDASDASGSIFIGSQAGSNSKNAANSIFIGTGTGQNSTDALSSSFIGFLAGNNAKNAANSNFLGNEAGQNAINASNSLFLGNRAGKNDAVNNVLTGGYSILIGQATNTGGFSNSIAIGTLAKNRSENEFMIGSPTVPFLQYDIVNPKYLNTRDDVSTATPINFLYTDADGKFLSAPTSALSSGWSLMGNTDIDTAINFIGTTDDKDFSIKVNNLQVGKFISNFSINNRSSLFLGTNAGTGVTNSSNATFIGNLAGQGANDATSSIFIGNQAGYGAVNAGHSIFIGEFAGSGDVISSPMPTTSILIGSGTHTGGFGNSIALGNGATNTAEDQFMIGGNTFYDMVIPKYPSSRDDVATTAPINFLYTDADGKFLSAPTSALSSGWSFTGNSGIDPALNFLGTTDDKELIFKVSNRQAGRLSTLTQFRTTAFGVGALEFNTGYNNTAVGFEALNRNTTGEENVAHGLVALRDNTTGYSNVAIGAQSLATNITGFENTALGAGALTNLKSGSNNIGIGSNTGIDLTSGSNNIYIGAVLAGPSPTVSNQLNIGGWIYGDNGKIGIGEPLPTEKLEVNGKIKAVDVNFSGLPTAADEAAAITLGLTTGDMYKTATGELRIKL